MANLEKQSDYALHPGTLPGPSSQMPLSRTCQNCATAKIRCNRAKDSQVCDRCQRLHKECIFRQAKRRHNGTAKDLRIEALEAKVNQLLDTGRSSPAGQSISSEPSSTGDLPRKLSSVALRASRSPNPSQDETMYSTGVVHAATISPDAYLCAANDVIFAGLLTIETANVLLDVYKSEMTPHFPFVVIPPSKTAEEFRVEKPFLFLTVLAAASYEDIILQRTLGKLVKQAISTRMILGDETSFELLQGLMVHLAWSQFHSRPRRYSQFLQLAISIIIDLRLDRPPHTSSWKTPMARRMENASGSTFSRASWGRDEQRAVAGCFYLSSSIAKILQKMVTLPHSAYIESCCKSLHDALEYPTDKYLLYIVQLQHILEKIDYLSIQKGANIDNPESAVEVYVKVLKAELDLFKERLPFAMSKSFTLLTQYYTVELYLYQISLHDPTSGIDPARPFPWSTWRLETLCSGLMAARSVLRSFLSQPELTAKAFTNSQWVQLGFAITVAAKLSIAATEKTVARETLSYRQSLAMSDILKELILRTGSLVTPYEDENGERDVFYQFAQRGIRIQAWFESHFPTDADAVAKSSENSSIDYTSSPSQVPYLSVTHDLNGFATNWGGISHLDSTSFPGELYGPPISQYLPDATIDEIMGDWTAYRMD